MSGYVDMNDNMNIVLKDATDCDCAICHNPLLESEHCYMLPECGHCFHTDCVVAWFRTKIANGRCPLCSHAGANQDNDYTKLSSRKARVSMVARHINNKDVPHWIKSEHARYMMLKTKQRDALKRIQEFRKTPGEINYRDGLQIMSKLNEKYWNICQKVGEQERILCDLPITPMIIPKYKTYYR